MNFKSALLSAALAACLVSCSDQTSPSGESGQSFISDAEATREWAGDWKLSRERSAMDGDVIVATKRVESGAAVFDLIVQCRANFLSIEIESYQAESGEGSAFLTQPNFFGFPQPVGRIKRNGGTPWPIQHHFGVGKYSNVLGYSAGFGRVPTGMFTDAIQVPEDAKELNHPRLIRDSLPIVLEVNNGLGAHELTIDHAGPVIKVLDACGGAGAPFVMPVQAPPTGLSQEELDLAATKAPEYEEHIAEVVEEALPVLEAEPESADWPSLDTDPPEAVPGITRDAVAINMSNPRYPPRAIREGRVGKVVLRLDVSADGSVANVEVDQSSRHKDLDMAAVDNARRWRFQPAMENGTPVPASLTVPVDFSL